MHPAWSVVIFTTIAGAGQGLFVALVAAHAFDAAPIRFLVVGAAISLALLGAGLISSLFHLGHPERGWRSAAMWRTSWLSREVIVLPAFMAAMFAWGVALQFGAARETVLWLGGLGVLLAIALFVCTGMIYACLPFLQEWRSPLTVVNYITLGCASGTTLAAALAAALHPSLARPFAIAALAIGAFAYLSRLASLARNARLRPRSTLATAIGVKHPKIAQISQGAMGGSFNTREFFHGRPREVVRAARWALLVLVFPVPALLLASGSHSAPVLAAAFVAQYAGLLAERWYFFAEARHPQNLYYQAIA